MTEDELIAAIAPLTQGIGDDAALWQPSRSHRSAISTDVLIEGVDFTREMMPLADAGWRAMAANLSDLAATGARPVLATVALGIPQAATRDDVLELYRGIAACADRYGAGIAGGDLSRAPSWTIAIAIVGEVRASNAKTRSGACPGDVLAVTGELGAARAGLELARRAQLFDDDLAEEALLAFRRPQPRIAQGRFFGASRNVRAMMDISDGLSTDVARLACASDCGAEVDAVPVAPCARWFAQRIGEEPQRFALAGGEDFELLVAIRARAFAHVAQRYEARFKSPLYRIGVLRAAHGVVWNGVALERSGWDHFAPAVRPGG